MWQVMEAMVERERIRELLVATGDRDGHTLLMCAARYCKDPTVIGNIIDAGAAVNDQDCAGMTALMYAARYNPDPRMCNALIARGAAVNTIDHRGWTAVDYSRLNTCAVAMKPILEAAGGRHGTERQERSITSSEEQEPSVGRESPGQPDFDRFQEEALTCNMPGLELGLEERIDGILIVIVRGYIDLYNMSGLRTIANRAIGMGYVRLVVDCKELEYVSSGFDLFISLKKAALERRGDVILARVPQQIRSIYELLGLSSLFKFCEDTGDGTLTTAFG
jgi:anti-anti-sigma factor